MPDRLPARCPGTLTDWGTGVPCTVSGTRFRGRLPTPRAGGFNRATPVNRLHPPGIATQPRPGAAAEFAEGRAMRVRPRGPRGRRRSAPGGRSAGPTASSPAPKAASVHPSAPCWIPWPPSKGHPWPSALTLPAARDAAQPGAEAPATVFMATPGEVETTIAGPRFSLWRRGGMVITPLDDDAEPARQIQVTEGDTDAATSPSVAGSPLQRRARPSGAGGAGLRASSLRPSARPGPAG